MTKQDVYNFIHAKTYAVISTCGKNEQPEAALIGFGDTEDLELIFGTYSSSKKYKNLQENSRVAFVIGWDSSEYVTVQYEGIASELFGEELEKYVALFHQKTPSSARYQSHPEQRYFKVQPTWIRYSDLGGEEEKIEEFTF